MTSLLTGTLLALCGALGEEGQPGIQTGIRSGWEKECKVHSFEALLPSVKAPEQLHPLLSASG